MGTVGTFKRNDLRSIRTLEESPTTTTTTSSSRLLLESVLATQIAVARLLALARVHLPVIASIYECLHHDVRARRNRAEPRRYELCIPGWFRVSSQALLLASRYHA